MAEPTAVTPPVEPLASLVPTLVVMAKPPVPGQVKTRLLVRYGPEQAVAIHEAMLRCVLDRLETHLEGPRVLAVADLPLHQGWAEAFAPGWRLIPQGQGNLGDRLATVWQAVDGGPVTFFGVDSPDVPAGSLRAIPGALAAAGAAAGPTDDGGYWTLAARRLTPALLMGIDWGTGRVYDQTFAAAQGAGLSLQPLPGWHDVDEPEDLVALRHRLTDVNEPPLRRLRDRLRQICGDEP